VWAVAVSRQPGADVNSGFAIDAIVVALFLDVALVISFWSRKSVRDCFEHKFLPPDRIAKLGKFRDGVEGVCIAVDVDPPHGSVFEIPGASYVVFEDDDGKAAIAVSDAALDADLSVEEADAIMAQAVSHILIGDILKPVRREGPLALFLAVAAECGLITFTVMIMAWAGKGWGWNALLGLVSTGVWYGSIFVVVLVAMKLAKIEEQNLFLADSIAAKITSNPGALKSAMMKLQDKDLSGYVNQTDGDVNIGKGKRFTLKRLDLKALESRIDNLTAIEAGHWVDFE